MPVRRGHAGAVHLPGAGGLALSLARRYLDAGKALDGDLLQRLSEHARRYGFLRMGRSQFMAGADADDYREKLTAYTEEDYEKERAQYALQLESAVHTERARGAVRAPPGNAPRSCTA